MRGLVIPLGVLAGALLACVSARRGEPVAAPLDVDDPVLRRGEVVFMQHCHQCHPGGDAGLGPALNNKPLTRGVVAAQVRTGLGAMPGFSDAEIDDEDLDALARYVVMLRRAPAP